MKILFATDGSGSAREAETMITSLLRRSARIHVLSVKHPAPVDLVSPSPEAAPAQAPAPDPVQIAIESATRLVDAGFRETTWAQRLGYPGEEIVAAIDQEAADLVVVGASHASWMGNFLLGSVSTYVLHHVGCPVLVTHRAPEGGRVLCAVDGSDSAAAATSLAANLLDPSLCTIHVATVSRGSWGSAHAAIPMMVHPSARSDHRGVEAEIEHRWRLIDRVRGELETLGFVTAGAVLHGTPSHQLMREIEQLPIDLAVVGCRGFGPIKRTFAGSVSEHLVRHSPATLVGGTARSRAGHKISSPAATSARWTRVASTDWEPAGQGSWA